MAPLAVQFTSPATDSAGNNVTNWNWNFGDGGASTNRSPWHTYTVAGTYSPSLSVTDSVTGTAVGVTGLQSVTVTNPLITVSVTPASGAVPLTVQFTSPGVDSLGDAITNWSWSFGDGSNSPAQSPTHVYAATGTFSPSLAAISTHGSAPLTVYGLSSVTVSNAPNPYFHVIYSLPANSSPNGGLVLSGGVLYGTTIYGGAVFAVGINGYGFTNLYVGLGRPEGGPVLAGSTLYGTTYGGGTNGLGSVFGINTNGTGFTNLYSFTGGNDGSTPKGALTLGGNVLYGATTTGGAGANAGAIFSYTLPSTLSSSVLLSIARSGTNVILTWSTNASSYALQFSAQAGAGASWSAASPAPAVVNGLETVTNAISGATKFYRLSQ